jgi:hypothetical protein
LSADLISVSLTRRRRRRRNGWPPGRAKGFQKFFKQSAKKQGENEMEKIVFVTWDCDEQPDVDSLNEAVLQISGKPVFRAIESQNDAVVVAVCRKSITQEQAQEAWEEEVGDFIDL